MLTTIGGFDRIGDENAFAVLARATQLAAEGRDIINLGIGQPDFPTPGHIVEAGVRALRDGHHGYTPATGIQPLREAVAADIHRRLNVEIDPGLVMIVPGGKVTMVRRHPDVRRTGRGNPLPRPRIPDLPLDDRIHRGDAGPGARSARRTALPFPPPKRCRW